VNTLSSRLLSGLAVLAALLLVPTGAQAQDVISSDRPGIGNGPDVVTPGTFQAELGYGFNREDSGNSERTLHDVGQLLLRLGVTDAVELRGGVGSLGFVSNGSSDSGYQGLNLGAKARFFQSETATVGALATTSLQSTQSGTFDGMDDRARQDLTLVGNFALGTRLSLTTNVGTQFYFTDDAEQSFTFIPTLNIGLNDQVGAYVGYAGTYTDGPNQNFVEGGLTFLATPNTQLDVNTGFRIDDNVDTGFFLGLGLAQRF